MAAVKELNEAGFDAEVVQWAKPSLVDFWAPWCGPCRMVGPVVEELVAECGESVNFFKVNADDNQALAARFGIAVIPPLLFFTDADFFDGQFGPAPQGMIPSKLKWSFAVCPAS